MVHVSETCSITFLIPHPWVNSGRWWLVRGSWRSLPNAHLQRVTAFSSREPPSPSKVSSYLPLDKTIPTLGRTRCREHAIEVLSTSGLSLPTPTNTFNQLSIYIFPMHKVHLNSGPGRSGPLIIPLHFLHTHSKEPPQKIVFLPVLVRHLSGRFQQVPPSRHTTLTQCRINVDATH